MSPSFLVPVVASLTLAVLVTSVHRRLPPAMAARIVAVATVVVAAAAVPTLWLVSLGFLAHTPWVGGGFAWCTHALGVHHQLPWWVGVPATGLVAVGSVRAIGAGRRHRRLRHDGPGTIEIAAHRAPFAVTLPGRGGHIVLSTGLVELLDESERRVVIAHERAHADHRHDRYLLLAELGDRAVPMLRPLGSRLRFSIERWADEAAVASCGDRHAVARTLGKVALHDVTPAGTLGVGGLGVAARMAALLHPPPAPAGRWARAGVWSAMAVTGAMGALQLHHLAGAVAALCHG